MKIFRRIILFILIVCIIIVSYFLVDGYILYKESITEKSLEDRISEIRSNESFTSISEVPSYYKDAVVSIEDHRFYSHFGVDIIATSRAMLDNILSFKMKGGGSSITQQDRKSVV